MRKIRHLLISASESLTRFTLVPLISPLSDGDFPPTLRSWMSLSLPRRLFVFNRCAIMTSVSESEARPPSCVCLAMPPWIQASVGLLSLSQARQILGCNFLSGHTVDILLLACRSKPTRIGIVLLSAPDLVTVGYLETEWKTDPE